MSEPRSWSVELDVREDADSMFVPADLLPDASEGDTVTLTSSLPETIRHGRIVAELDDAVRGRFFNVALD